MFTSSWYVKKNPEAKKIKKCNAEKLTEYIKNCKAKNNHKAESIKYIQLKRGLTTIYEAEDLWNVVKSPE